MLFKDPQYAWAAIISNITWDLGTTATSSNLSSDDLCEGSRASAAKFINQTYANLQEQTAVGSGQHLTAVLDILGCQGEVRNGVIGEIRADLRKSMQSPAFKDKSRSENAEGFYDSLIKHIEQKYSQQCALS